jgi:hypothetical protein
MKRMMKRRMKLKDSFWVYGASSVLPWKHGHGGAARVWLRLMGQLQGCHLGAP